jgi:hypothetical protein
MHLDLADEETLALLNRLTETIENDGYSLSPRIQTLRCILAKFGRIALRSSPPDRPPTPGRARRLAALRLRAAARVNRPQPKQFLDQLG